MTKAAVQPIRNITGPAQPIMHSQVAPRKNQATTTPDKPPSVSAVQTMPETLQTPTPLQISNHQQQIQQQMQQQVAQAAALGRPMAPGTKLMSPDGAIGIVQSNNSITVTYPSNFPQRVAQTQLQRESYVVVTCVLY